MILGNKDDTDREEELEQIRRRLTQLLGARTAVGLNQAQQHEYAELCARELTLIRAPGIIEVTGRVIDLDEGVEVDRQRQHR